MMSDMRLSCRDSHHRALAGGTSTSQLQSWGKQFGTPPGFSRWCFNFTTIKLGKTVGTPPGFSRWYFNFGATMRCSPESAMKLKYHRLKPGGVPTVFPSFVVLKLKYHRLKPGGVPTVFPSFVVVKLKYHRLNPGGVPTVFPSFVVVKLKYHRLKPGGVPNCFPQLCSCEVEVPPAKARWCESRQDRRISDIIGGRSIHPIVYQPSLECHHAQLAHRGILA